MAPEVSVEKHRFDPGFEALPAIRCLLVLIPYLLLFFVTADRSWLDAAIVAAGLFKTAETLGLGPWPMLIQWGATVGAFAVLLLTIGWPFVFALLVAALAAAVIAGTRRSQPLKSFGNWIFIPAIYLACQEGENQTWDARVARLPHDLAMTLLAPLVVGGLRWIWAPARSKPLSHSLRSLSECLADPNPDWSRQMLAAFGAILVVTAIAEAYQLPNRQWIIWSALSVIALDLRASRAKIRDRMFGVLVGCPLGFVVGLLLPADPVAYSLSVLAIVVTLVAFRAYRFAFTLRCALTAFAAMMAGGSVAIAEERVINVIAGGVAGVIALHVAMAVPAKGRASERGTREPG